jgi:hypothetical protein
MTKVYLTPIAPNHELAGDKDQVFEINDLNIDQNGKIHAVNLQSLKGMPWILSGLNLYSLSTGAYELYIGKQHRKVVYITPIDENGDAICGEVGFEMDHEGFTFNKIGHKLAKHDISTRDIPADGYTVKNGYVYSLKPGNYAEYLKWRDTESSKEKPEISKKFKVLHSKYFDEKNIDTFSSKEILERYKQISNGMKEESSKSKNLLKEALDSTIEIIKKLNVDNCKMETDCSNCEFKDKCENTEEDNLQETLENLEERISNLESFIVGENEGESDIQPVEDFLNDNGFVRAVLVGINDAGEVYEFRFGEKQ